MPQTLTDIKALLAAHGLRPKHRLGQNFLHDHNHMARIIAAAAIERGDIVLEVGAGTGSLSEALLEAGARLVTVEIDRDLEPILQQRLAPYRERLRIYMGDILKGKHTVNPEVVALLDEVAALPGSSSRSLGTTFKLVANLPYHVASPLLVDLAMDYPSLKMGVVMVQREVADRLVAGPGSKVYGPLSILVQAMCEVVRLATLPPSCFWPRPKVASAVVRLRRRSEPITADPHRLAGMVQRLFQHRRKQIGAILGRDVALPPGVTGRDRPETLNVEQLEELARTGEGC